MKSVVEAALEATRAGDCQAVRQTLHPYLHWIGADGSVLRGRSRVLAMLADAPVPKPPASVEIRDSQIYRWLA